MADRRRTERPNNLATLQRRQALAAIGAVPAAAALAAAPPARAATRRTPTPTQTLGPFYPRTVAEKPREIDADLLNLQGDQVLAQGVPIHLTGRVVDRDDRPVAAALVEIWQCDANAVYHHPAGGAADERDRNFQGYGQTMTEADGSFHFRTIRPVPYPGRTPHIHIRVRARGHDALGTQLYLPDAPDNERDFLYRQLDAAGRAALALHLKPTAAAHPLARGTQFTAQIELVLA
jgi:protocatechuate 3,4-dioxygenase beta subunit